MLLYERAARDLQIPIASEAFTITVRDLAGQWWSVVILRSGATVLYQLHGGAHGARRLQVTTGRVDDGGRFSLGHPAFAEAAEVLAQLGGRVIFEQGAYFIRFRCGCRQPCWCSICALVGSACSTTGCPGTSGARGYCIHCTGGG